MERDESSLNTVCSGASTVHKNPIVHSMVHSVTPDTRMLHDSVCQIGSLGLQALGPPIPGPLNIVSSYYESIK